jgi:hypothetical protein
VSQQPHRQRTCRSEPRRRFRGWEREHGVQKVIDGADRDPLERWLAAYLDIPKLNEHETAMLHARLTDVPRFGYVDVDTAAPGGLGEILGPLEGMAHSAHAVTNKDGSLGMLVLAETDDTAPFLEVFADLEVVGEIELGGQRVQTLEGIDGYAFIWTESGISGSLTTNPDNVAAARRFFEAFLES